MVLVNEHDLIFIDQIDSLFTMADEQESSLFTKHSERRKEFQKTINPEQSRRRREDARFALRKQQREDNLEKRRRQTAEMDQFQSGARSAIIPRNYEAIKALMAGLLSDDHDAMLQSTMEFRKLLSIERNPPIDEVIKVGAVPRLIQFLQRVDHSALQFQAAWALTNIASGTSVHTRVVVDAGGVPIFVELLKSPDEEVREQAVWALGNIAGDAPDCRDLVLNSGAMQPLLALCTTEAKITLLRNATWTLSNFCRGKPQPSFSQIIPALPTLNLLLLVKDDDVLADAAWALSYMSDDNSGGNEKIQSVVESGCVKRIIELLGTQASNSIKTPALRTAGNIVTGDDVQTQVAINYGLLDVLSELLQNEKKSIRKEACWTLSNITAGNPEQIGQVLDHNLVQPLVRLLREEVFDIRKEAAWAISNATSGGSEEQIRYLVRQGVIPPMVELLNCPDVRIILVAMEGLENILRVGYEDSLKNNTNNIFADYVEEAGGIDKLEAVQTHANADVYEKAVQIVTEFFAGDEDVENEELAPQVDSMGGFQFGAQGGNTNGGGAFNF
eukprot:752256_1